MGVIDIFKRNNSVEYGLHRGIGRIGIRHRSPLCGHHVWIRQFGQFGHSLQGMKAHRGKTFRFDSGQVPTAAFDIENRLFFAKKVSDFRFYRGIATTMQHEGGILTQ